MIHHAEIIFRHAEPRDAPAIEEIERMSFVHAGERYALRKVAHLIQSPRAVTFVAERQGVVMGWVVGFSWTRTSNPWGRIYGLAVHPDSRGLKLGQALLKKIIGYLHARGGKRIFLEVRVGNDGAIALYEKLGFVNCRLMDDYYGPGLAAHRMELQESKIAAHLG